MAQSNHRNTYGAERGLSRFEGFSDAVFAIALTLLIVVVNGWNRVQVGFRAIHPSAERKAA